MANGMPLRFVFASDSFKGTLSSADTARLLEVAARRAHPGCSCVFVPMADGGEGTVDALVSACGGTYRDLVVSDPVGRSVTAHYGLLGEGRAVIEMAAASGLPLVDKGERDPRRTSTFGTGQLLLDALDAGCADVTLAIGGSATNDGGMGCLRALGVRFLDAEGIELRGVGADLARVTEIDASGLDRRVGRIRLRVMCDVDNPLCGPCGATRVFAPQKGASPQVVEELEWGMRNYARRLEACSDRAVDVPGAGAAGGLGAACLALLGARLVSGVDAVLELVGLDRLLEGASLCVTGEGRYDGQTARGKVVSGVAAACARAHVPCVALVGSRDPQAELVPGLSGIEVSAPEGMPLPEALARSRELYAAAARRLFELWP